MLPYYLIWLSLAVLIPVLFFVSPVSRVLLPEPYGPGPRAEGKLVYSNFQPVSPSVLALWYSSSTLLLGLLCTAWMLLQKNADAR